MPYQSVVIAELAYWVRTKEGRQRQALQAWLTRVVDALHGRIHGFNVSVAHVWAEQERLLDNAGQRMPVEHRHIAATARRHGLTIATGNDRASALTAGPRSSHSPLSTPPFCPTRRFSFSLAGLKVSRNSLVVAVLSHLTWREQSPHVLRPVFDDDDRRWFGLLIRIRQLLEHQEALSVGRHVIRVRSLDQTKSVVVRPL